MYATTYTGLECPTERALLHTLLYFELFSHPLRAEEVFYYCNDESASPEIVAGKLQSLTEQGIVFQFGSFYQTQNDASWLSKRLEYNRRADQMLPIAHRRAKLIGKFPFVRGVFVSGSLSKHCMRADSDVDFFIVTAPGRLWLARTLLVLFKKIFLLNSHKYFCVNYFIDTEHLEIEEKNRFTATEAVTLVPMYGREYFEAFLEANSWAWEQYPNFPKRDTSKVPVNSAIRLKKALEKLLSGRVGEWLDKRFMQLTVKVWKRKFKHFDAARFDVAMKSRRYVSKHHPLHFQEKVLQRLEARMREM